MNHFLKKPIFYFSGFTGIRPKEQGSRLDLAPPRSRPNLAVLRPMLCRAFRSLPRLVRAGRSLRAPSRARGVCASRGMRGMSTYYTKDHEYIKVDGSSGTVGISDHAQSELGDVVFVEFPDIGETFSQGESFGSVESVKAASSVYAPVDIEVTAVNEEVDDNYALVNESAESDGWMLKVEITNPSQLEGLMDADAYAKFCESSE